MFKGPIVTGPDCVGPDCAGSDSVGLDCAGPDHTCTENSILYLENAFDITLSFSVSLSIFNSVVSLCLFSSLSSDSPIVGLIHNGISQTGTIQNGTIKNNTIL